MKKIGKMVLLIAWMGLIFFFSYENGEESTLTSNGFSYYIYQALHFLIPSLKISLEDFIIQYVPAIRKCAHFTEFTILGFLVYWNLIEYLRKYELRIALIFCGCYAIFDELHQLFVPNRYCSVIDMLIDFSGATVGTLLCHLIVKKWKKSV